MLNLTKEIDINGRKIGPNHPPVVIAEIGINHNGSLQEALKIADAAINAGAEIIKHQTHIISDEMSEEAKHVIPGHTKESIYEIMNSCALTESEEWELFKYIVFFQVHLFAGFLKIWNRAKGAFSNHHFAGV